MRLIRRFNRFILIVAYSVGLMLLVKSLPMVAAIFIYMFLAIVVDVLVTIAIEKLNFVDFISLKALEADEYENTHWPKKD